MKVFASFIISVLLIGLALAQPPRKEEEDPKAKGKTPPPIDIDSFPDPKKPNPKTKAPEPKGPEGPGVIPKSGTLVVGVRQLPVRISPSRARTDSERWALDLIFEGLLRPVALDGSTTFMPGLAIEPPRPEQDGRVFSIDPAAIWTDANHTPVLASDVVATLDRLRSAGDEYLGEAFTDAPRRLRLTFKTLHPDFAALCAFKIVPAGRDDEEFARHPYGSGPFIYSGNVTEGQREYSVFKPNPQYAQRAGRANRPLLREVRFLACNEPAADFRRGLVDVVVEESTVAIARAGGTELPKTPTGAQMIQSTHLANGLGADARLYTRPSRRIYYLAANPIKSALGGDAGRNLRRAVAFAINREKILDGTLRAPGYVPETGQIHRALTGPFPAESWPCDATSGSLDDDSLARAELKAMKAPPGKLILVYPSNEPLASQAAPMIADHLTVVGITTEAHGLPDEEFRRTVFGEKAFDLAWRHFDFRDDWFDPGELFNAENGGMGGAGTGATRLESALTRCSARCEFAALRDARRRLHHEFREVMPFIPLWCPEMHIVLRRGVEPVPTADLLDPLQPFAEIDHWKASR